jgi:hypothetical protein
MDGPDMFGLECNEDASPKIDKGGMIKIKTKYVPVDLSNEKHRH